jgi:hypothetical protein
MTAHMIRLQNHSTEQQPGQIGDLDVDLEGGASRPEARFFIDDRLKSIY